MEKECTIHCDKTCCSKNDGKAECNNAELKEKFKDKTFVIMQDCKECNCKK